MIWLSGVPPGSKESEKGKEMKIDIKITWLMVGVSLLVCACSSAGEDISPTPQPETVLTAAAQTAAAQLTELAKPGPTTTLPANTTPLVTPTGITDLTSTPADGTTSTIIPTVASGGVDLAEFWADITVPDGTNFDPGEQFTKVWQIRNAGTNTWTTDYGLAFFGGAQMSAPTEVPLTANVPPGETVDVSADLVAPESGGTYTGFWKMRNPAGEYFDYAVFVQIDVVGEAPSGTTTPKPSGTGSVTGASIKVDDSSPADCPHTFTFTASFTLSEPATVTYRLEAGSDTPGFTFNLPGDLTGSFEGGTHSVVYYLQIQDTVEGWAQFHIVSPNKVTSKQANFSLSCGS